LQESVDAAANLPVLFAQCVHTLVPAAAGEGRRGWALLRASLHDPLLVINIESEVEGGARATAAQVCTASSLT
jgi:phosphomannomutase